MLVKLLDPATACAVSHLQGAFVEFTFSPTDEAFRLEVRTWLAAHLVGEFRTLGTGNNLGEGDELVVRKRWERELASGGWVGLGWPKEHGGKDLPLTQQMIFNEEYARAGGPARVGFFGEQLLGPTLMALGTPEQKARFLPPILRAEEYWCQGFSEPDAGSDLANVKTTAVRDGDEWTLNGQKVWTSLGHVADWIFVVCRTDASVAKHKGISFILCPMDQAGIELRPIRQITGTAEFNEVFFTDARTSADMIVGPVNGGWSVVMATLGFERGTAFMAQQLRFANEYRALVTLAKERGHMTDPIMRQRFAESYTGLEIMRLTGLRAVSQLLSGKPLGSESSIGKLHWSKWHQQLGELAMDVLGPDAVIGSDGHLGDLQYTFLFSRSHTIYAGSSEIQRNIVGERVLGLPKEPA
jgi:alkylation response protein AidB-like acyl-CoA dehydrogenase